MPPWKKPNRYCNIKRALRKIIMKNLFSEKAIEYYLNLSAPDGLPASVKIMNPYKNEEVKNIVKKFYGKFFNDDRKRIFIIGINPGRFGGGVTGIGFTDPKTLNDFCGIKNTFDKRLELSSNFIYSMIDNFGGANKFYSKYFITALFPLALIKSGKNYNYYDDKKLYKILKPEILSSIKKQIDFGAHNNLAVSLGKRNFLYLKELNDEIKFFKKIEYLEHPRFIMQYKRKQIDSYIKKYLNLLKN